MKMWIEAIGWSGAILILLAYGLNSAGRLGVRSPLYQLMNIVGAAGFIVNSGFNGALPSVGLNVVWMGIGVYSLLWRRRTGQQ